MKTVSRQSEQSLRRDKKRWEHIIANIRLLMCWTTKYYYKWSPKPSIISCQWSINTANAPVKASKKLKSDGCLPLTIIYGQVVAEVESRLWSLYEGKQINVCITIIIIEHYLFIVLIERRLPIRKLCTAPIKSLFSSYRMFWLIRSNCCIRQCLLYKFIYIN